MDLNIAANGKGSTRIEEANMRINRRKFLEQSLLGVTGLSCLSGLKCLAVRVGPKNFRNNSFEFRSQVMSSNRNTNILQVSTHSSGQLIPVGLPWDAGLFIQEYWFQEIPHYAMVNISQETVEVGLAEWTGVVGQPLTTVWRLEPNKVICHELASLANSYSGELIAVSLNQNPIHGLLKAPQPLPCSKRWDKLNRFATLDGLNGTGDRNANLCFIQEKLILDSGKTYSLMLQLPANIGTISFEQTSIPGGLLQASVIRAESNSLSVEERDSILFIGEREISAANYQEVILTVNLPEVEAETMTVVLGRLDSPSGAGFSFARGLITKPVRP